MNELLSQTYYQNTLQEWVIGPGIIVASIVLGKAVYRVFSRVMRTFTSRSKARVDDIIVDMVEEPVVFMIIASGIWFGLQTLINVNA